QAVTEARAPGVDVSSGVESTPGVKDGNMIAAFLAEARAAAGRLGAARPSG
ncbi:MAG TPA: N-(5'-phosphoribosyl)anthranilate isomerase, partial [Methylocella sp.]|nr:N-(5'-phosphoribosyl)anthranilate isomerase [Methylocella sp.]